MLAKSLTVIFSLDMEDLMCDSSVQVLDNLVGGDDSLIQAT